MYFWSDRALLATMGIVVSPRACVHGYSLPFSFDDEFRVSRTRRSETKTRQKEQEGRREKEFARVDCPGNFRDLAEGCREVQRGAEGCGAIRGENLTDSTAIRTTHDAVFRTAVPYLSVYLVYRIFEMILRESLSN